MKSGLIGKMKHAVASGVAASLLCFPLFAGAVGEVEPNDTQLDSQLLVVSTDGEALVQAILGSGSGVPTTDIDVYVFDGKTGDVPSISLSTAADWDAVLYLFDATGVLLDISDDAYPPTEGSLCIQDTTLVCDPRIDLRPLDADGTYYVVVAPAMRFVMYGANGFEVHPAFLDAQAGGNYDLLLRGVTPLATAADTTDDGNTAEESLVSTTSEGEGTDDTGDMGDSGTTDTSVAMMEVGDPNVLEVVITAKRPGKKDNGLGKYKGGKAIPVAIHSALPGFDAVKDVDLSSLTFGATGYEQSLLKCKKKGKRVKIDGVKDRSKDLVCYFRPDLANIKEGDMSATLRGRTKDGKELAGSGVLRVMKLPTEKTMNWYERHDADPQAVRAKDVKKHKKAKKKKDKKGKGKNIVSND